MMSVESTALYHSCSGISLEDRRLHSSLSASSSKPSSRRCRRRRRRRRRAHFPCASSTSTTSTKLLPPHDIIVPLPSSGKLKPPARIERAILEYPWRGGLEPIENRFDAVRCKTVFGEVPEEVKGGTLYRLGPGRCRLGSTKYAHWFDGDGCMHEVRFDKESGEFTMRSAMVETERYKEQELRAAKGKADLVGARGAWTQATNIMDNLGKFPTNPGNTSPVMFNGSLLALCEGGPPIEIDRETLKTKGEYTKKFTGDLSGFPMGFAAHSKVDANDGFMYAWGLAKPPALGHRFAKISPSGEVLKTTSVPLPDPLGFYLLHDACDTENYIIFVVVPWKATAGQIMPALIGVESFGHSFSYDANAKTRIVAMRKSDLSVVMEVDVENFSSYHNAGAYEDEQGNIHALVCKLEGDRPDLEKNFSDMYNSVWTSKQYNHLYDVCLSVKEKKVLSQTKIGGDGAKPMEFPVLSTTWTQSVAKTKAMPKYIFTLCFGESGGGYFDTIQKVATQGLNNNNHLEYRSKPGYFPAEVAFVPKINAQKEDDGYLLFVEYAANRHASDVVILAAETMEEVYRAESSYHIPYTFHGYWDSNA